MSKRSKRAKAAIPVPPSPEMPQAPAQAVAAEPSGTKSSRGPIVTALQLWLSAYRTEVILFFACFFVLACFSSERFLRQSAAPHFVYQAKAWVDGRLDLDPTVLPNLEDWACAREIGGQKVRCEPPLQPTDKWYVSFPPFPALLMVPFVAVNGYQLNDTSLGVILGALAIAFFYSFLRFLSRQGESGRTDGENVVLALTLAFGTVFFYCAIRGEVWFLAEVMGVGLTALYLRNSVGARRPVLAGLFFSMATLTRTPLVFTGLFFLLECLCPGPENRIAQLKALPQKFDVPMRKLGLFVAGAAPLAILAAWFNFVRFGSFGEFGHRFLFNNRVNADIDQYGLFNPIYLFDRVENGVRHIGNLSSAFFLFPGIQFNPFRLTWDPNGLSLLLTLPILVFLIFPKEKRRLHWPLWLTVAVCALPGLLYQNNGYIQFGFRFSLDYTPHLMTLFAIGGWPLRDRRVAAVIALGVLVNFWGAIAFRGYTEMVRGW